MNVVRTQLRRGRHLLNGLFVLVLAVVAPGGALGHDEGHEQEPKKVPDAEAHRPSAIPDRIILTWADDPAHSQAVTWRTNASVTKALAQIAPADAGPNFVANARSVPAKTTDLTTDLGPAHYHSVRFENLAAKTTYAYRVGDGVNWSEWIHFQTANDRPEPFSFIYFGDAQNDIKSLWSRVIRGAYSDAPKAAFIVHAGDLINRAESDAEWGEWFGAGGWVNAMVASIPSPGNHEYRRVDAPKVNTEPSPTDSPKAKTPSDPKKAAPAKLALSRHWRPQFTLPENGPAGLEETVYFIDYQGVRIISLNSNEDRERQVGWLDRVLADNPNRWTVVTFHHPIYSSAKNRDNPELRRLWQPVFDRHRVDLVLQGHDHTYARSGLRRSENVPTGTSAQDQEAGTVYVVSVSGPKMYDLKRGDWMKRAAEDTQLYQIVSIDGATLRYEARTATGQLYDCFELRKRDGQPNELIEKAPKTPERLRPPKAPDTKDRQAASRTTAPTAP
jgi:3',5'-cyclic AMP phosphodiesterase CpdA